MGVVVALFLVVVFFYDLDKFIRRASLYLRIVMCLLWLLGPATKYNYSCVLECVMLCFPSDRSVS